MPRGKYYPEELRQEARRLRLEGWSLNEISAKLGPPKNTLTLWVRDIKLTAEQRARLLEKERVAIGENRVLAAAVNRQARLDRIALQQRKAEAFLNTSTDKDRINHVAAAMLYLGEGAKGESSFQFANSNPQIIRYWMYLLRTNFDIDEAKFRLRVLYRADQDVAELQQYWSNITGVRHYTKSQPDSRTEGIPTQRLSYKGVCVISYHDITLRRYLDALAHGLMHRAVGAL